MAYNTMTTTHSYASPVVVPIPEGGNVSCKRSKCGPNFRRGGGLLKGGRSAAKCHAFSNDFLGGGSIPRGPTNGPLGQKPYTRVVCLFGRRQRSFRAEQQQQTLRVVERTERDKLERAERDELERIEREKAIPTVVQAVQPPVRYSRSIPPPAALIAALLGAGLMVLATKLVTRLRGELVTGKSRSAFMGSEEEATLLLNARNKLGQAIAENVAEYGTDVTRPQVASMMSSAADYLYLLANEVADTKALLDDKEERLALANRRSKQDANERKELIRRISMAEAELVEGQLKQAADASAAAAHERELEEEKAAEIERLIARHKDQLDEMRAQAAHMERDAEAAEAANKKLSEEVRALKQGLKEKETKLATAMRKAEEDKQLNSSLSTLLETATSKLTSALSRETELENSLKEKTSGIQGAEQQLERMQRRHEEEIRAVRGIALAQAKGLEERLRTAQERMEQVHEQKEAEASARAEAEASAEELQSQIEQLEQDLIYLETKYKEAKTKLDAPPAEPKETVDLERLREDLESKTQQAQVAKELVLQFMENEREKDLELKKLRGEMAQTQERLEELERELEVTVALRIGDALDGSGGSDPGGDDGGGGARERFERELETVRQEKDREISTLRATLEDTQAQLVRVQKQHSIEMETKLGKQEREFRMKLGERESERDGCLVKVGSLEEELALEVQGREQARRELGTVQEQLLEWERRALKIEAAHATALETEREASRQKLEALYLDYEKARDEALEKENQRVALAQQSEQLQVALAEARSQRKLEAAKVNEVETAMALNEDIIKEAQAKQSRVQAELELFATHHATTVESLEDARAEESKAAQKEQERLEGEVSFLREQVRALESAVEKAERANEETQAQVAVLESTNAETSQRLAWVSELEKQLSSNDALQDALRNLVAELEDLTRAKDDVIRSLRDEKEAAVSDALQRLEEIDALKGTVQELVEEQQRAVEEFKAEVDTGGKELTRVRQRLVEVERALAASQEELQGAKLEEERLSLELAATKASADEQRESFQKKVEGLERALQLSGSELELSAKREEELREGVNEKADTRENVLEELKEREEVIAFFQRYFEERSALDVQLYDLGRLSLKIEALKQQPVGAGVNGLPGDVPALEREFSAQLQKFEAAVIATAATFGGVLKDQTGVPNGGGLGKRVYGAVRNGVPVPRALDLVGVAEVVGSSLADLNGRLFTAEQKADELQTEIRQRIVRQLEWQEDKKQGGADVGENGGSERETQQSEIQERVSQMMQSLAQKDKADDQ